MIDGVTQVIQLEQLLEQGKTAADIREIVNKNKKGDKQEEKKEEKKEEKQEAK
jgi:hypothetical protein